MHLMITVLSFLILPQAMFIHHTLFVQLLSPLLKLLLARRLANVLRLYGPLAIAH